MKTAPGLAGRMFLAVAVIALTAVGLDELLIRSDMRSLGLLVMSLLFAGAVGTLVLTALLIPAARLVGRVSALERATAAGPLAVCVSGAAVILGQPVLRRLDQEWALPWVYVGSGVLYLLLTRRRREVSPGLDRFGVVLLLVALVALPLWIAGDAATGSPEPGRLDTEDNRRGLVLLVVDALGAECISGLNPEAPIPTPSIDSFLDRSRTFPNSHTSFPYTFGAFRTLYSGRVGPGPPERGTNLVRALQSRGTDVRIVASHFNAMPDNKGMRYSGLRSLLLTQNFTWLPRLVGADYHVMTYLDTARTKGDSQGRRRDRLELVRRTMNSRSEVQDPFAIGLGEIQHLMSQDRPFLLMLHMFFNDTQDSLSKPLTYDLHPERSEKERADTGRSIRQNSYRYTDEQAWWAEEYRAAYLDQLADFDAAFGRFMAEFSARGYGPSVDLVLTADHGSAWQDNELWYSYHSSESSIRVPLAVFREGGIAVRSNRPCTTVDVAATIADWFGLDSSEFSHTGASLLSDPPASPALCFVRRGADNLARTVSFTENRKDVFEVDQEHRTRWVRSQTIGPDGRVADAAADPGDPRDLAARVQQYCETGECLH